MIERLEWSLIFQVDSVWLERFFVEEEIRNVFFGMDEDKFSVLMG